MAGVDLTPNITDIITKINDLQNRVTTYKSSIASTPATSRTEEQQSAINSLNETIKTEATSIGTLIAGIQGKKTDNEGAMDFKTPILLDKLNQLKSQYALVEENVYGDDNHLDAANELSEIRVEANFNVYLIYFICTLFLAASLFYIQHNPDVKNLDMFILNLAILLSLYYLYEYLMTKAFVKRWIQTFKTALANMKQRIIIFLGGSHISMTTPPSSK
jgi:hypothetical protein